MTYVTLFNKDHVPIKSLILHKQSLYLRGDTFKTLVHKMKKPRGYRYYCAVTDKGEVFHSNAEYILYQVPRKSRALLEEMLADYGGEIDCDSELWDHPDLPPLKDKGWVTRQEIPNQSVLGIAPLALIRARVLRPNRRHEFDFIQSKGWSIRGKS